MRISGGILAGGIGARFGGADKGWLRHDGRAFVERVIDALTPQVDEIVISANRNIVRYAALGHPVVTDDVGAGPAAGLLRILETALHPWVLCVPVDALALPPTLGCDLADAQWAHEADVVVLHDGTRAHPTCSLVRRCLAPDLRRYLERGHSALWQWQERQRIAYAEVEAPLLNINEPDALARLRAGEP